MFFVNFLVNSSRIFLYSMALDTKAAETLVEFGGVSPSSKRDMLHILVSTSLIDYRTNIVLRIWGLHEFSLTVGCAQ